MNLQDTVRTVLTALDEAQVPYMLVGSFSTNAYGIERSTRDLDVVVELGEHSILAIARKLPTVIRLDPQMRFETVTMTRKYEASIDDSLFTIEFFLLSDDPHDQERFRRRVRSLTPDGQVVTLPTPEDVIITKLRWALLARRSKDREDARDVIAVQDVDGRLDWPYIEGWCDRHGTRVLLDEVRASIPPI